MHRLSYLILLIFLTRIGYGQSPHGKGLTIDCAQCHTSDSWKLNLTSLKFKHSTTSFPLEGQHKTVDCKSCHSSLKFENASSECVSCHQDMHNQTVGNDCARCHDSNSWIVSNITRIHEQTSFPLTGVHATVDCNQCHQTGTNINFKPIGLTCIDCHNSDFRKTTNPDHTKLNLSTECSECHNASVDWASANFPNHNEFYPLTGAHASIANDCEKCHIGGNFNNTPTECVGCHSQDFVQTVNPNHNSIGISQDCASCHTTAPGWQPATFANHDEFYPLTGGHLNIANDCASCHNGDYNNTPTDCFACHNTDYASTANPNHTSLGFSNDCAQCHTTSPNWTPATFADHNNFFPITGAHVGLSCNECHINGDYNSASSDCFSCHNTQFASTKNPNHNEFAFSTDCASCHTTKPGWSPARFDEHNNFYPLTGAHAPLGCAECHSSGTYSGTTTDCNSCHSNNYTNAKSPNHQVIGISTDCASCHTTNPGWSPSTFDHNLFYPLTGAHASVANECQLCHTNGNTKNTPTDCNACHNSAYQATVNPSHSKLGLSTDCASCHSTNTGWKPTTFDHNAFYPLTGAHANIAQDCNQCHSGLASETSQDCNSCHNAAYQSTSNPNHAAMGLSTDCASCHTTNPGWTPSFFSHDFYPLTGAHAVIARNCNKCHADGNVSNTPTDCNSCHSAAYQNTSNPNHAAMGLSTDCASCHTTNPGWTPSFFSHDFYPLTGAHGDIARDCNKCHANGNVSNTPTDCNACHNSAYQSTSNPNHGAMGLSTDCASCHTTTPGWTPSFFSHDFYPLTGAHSNISRDCNKCHANGNVANTPTDCNSCHNSAYQSASNPNHAASGFSTDCASCHTTNPGWRPSTFNHNNFYPLTGAHANVASNCTSCHANGNYNNTPTDCNSCHNSAYQSASNPNHAVSGFSTDCASCHTTNPGWRPSTFNHNNFYPLTGAHANIASNCTSCHFNGNYNNTPTDCNSCHNSAYQSASNPNHAASGFSTDCASCHTTNPGWRPSTFNHNNFYTLTGAHANIASNCTSCHANGNYNNTPTDCNSCHNSAYQNARNPNHASSGFSTDCASCHTTNPGWSPATFDHDNSYFPIYSGKHRGEWNSCTDCHTSSGNYAIFSCFKCHGKSSTDKDHRGVNGYAYNSNSCYSCHPRGEED